MEKLSLMEAELRGRDARLEDSQQEMARMSKATAPDISGPDIEAARSSYSGFIDGLRDKVAGELAGAKIARTSVFPIQGPDPANPIVSKVAFRIVGANGRAGEMMIPLYADASGKWQEPAAADLAAFKAGLNAAPQVTGNEIAAPAPKRLDTPKDVMGADRTVEVQWDDAAPTAGKGQSQAQPQQPAPQPAAPELPKKVMPTSRDVIIDIE